MIDKNYMFENDKYVAYIQEVKDLGNFLEIEIKNIKNTDETIYYLIKYVKCLNLKIGSKYDIKKAEKFYNKIKVMVI